MSFTNQALGLVGTAAGAAAVAKHLSQQKQANELQAISEGEQLNKESSEIIKEASNLQDEYIGTENYVQDLQDKLAESENWTGPFRDSKTGKYITKDKYQEAMQLALKETKQKQNAIEMQRADLANRLDYYNKRVDATNSIKKGVAPDLSKKLTSNESKSAINWVKEVNK